MARRVRGSAHDNENYERHQVKGSGVPILTFASCASIVE
jgi:hypothetical protein